MEILLVDLITGDHSIPYANGVKQNLETKENISNVDFLTLDEGDRLDMDNYFSQNDGIYFIQHDHEGGSPGYNDPIIDAFEKMVDFIKQDSYDVVHILQVDNVLLAAPLARLGRSGAPPRDLGDGQGRRPGCRK